MTVVNVAATLTSIAVSGPSSVNEGGTGTYTATATWSDSSTTSVTPTWSASLRDDQRCGAVHRAVSDGEPDGEHRCELHQRRRDADGDAVRDRRERGGDADQHRGERPVVGERGRYRDVHGDGDLERQLDHIGHPDLERVPRRDDQRCGGVFTAPSVTANQTASIGASYTSGGVTRTASQSVTVVNVAATLTSIAVSGPSSVNEGGTGTYTATATWSDSSTTSVTPTWSASLGTISAAGLFTAPSVTANQTASIGASYTSGGVTRTASQSVTVVNVAATLTSIAVSGPSSVNEGGTGTYTATGTWDNGTTAAITPTWSENSSYATITPGGVLTASAVTSNQTVTVTASYGGRTGTMSVTIVDVLGAAPAAPKNIDITGPVSSVSTSSVSTPSMSAPPVSTQIYRLYWDPVTTTWDGTPIDPVRTVRYTAYWTDDPALSAASLRPLASLISGTALDFDPSENQMMKNQVAYLTVRAILDTGDQSSLAASLTWRVENSGPVPPAKGKIIKK